MPFQRPTLTSLKTMAAQDINSALSGVDALLRFSNLNILSVVIARMTNLLYGYLDYISLQSTPFTATDEALLAWAALKNIFLKPATQAHGVISFPAVIGSGATVPINTPISRSDGVQFISTANASESGGVVLVPAEAVADPTGQTGAFGNTAVGVTMTLGNSITNVTAVGTVSTAFTGGADIETQDSLRTRMLIAYQTVPGSGTAGDYISWALQTPGVTRAWCSPNQMGSGTVTIYTMFDAVESAYGGFPQGTNGCATGETRDVTATGDQLAVANTIFALQPVTALVYSNAPGNGAVNITINGISGVSSDTKAQIAAALTQVFLDNGAPGGSRDATNTTLTGQVNISDLEAAISSVSGTAGFTLTSPTLNPVPATGVLLTLGTVTYT